METGIASNGQQQNLSISLNVKNGTIFSIKGWLNDTLIFDTEGGNASFYGVAPPSVKIRLHAIGVDKSVIEYAIKCGGNNKSGSLTISGGHDEETIIL